MSSQATLHWNHAVPSSGRATTFPLLSLYSTFLTVAPHADSARHAHLFNVSLLDIPKLFDSVLMKQAGFRSSK